MYDELVKRLREDAPTALANCDFDFIEGWIKEAANAIELLQKAQQPKWIPVTERLPKDLQNVLVVDEGRVSIGHCEHFYGDEQIYVEWHDTLYYPIDPPYWMPLPSTEGLNET